MGFFSDKVGSIVKVLSGERERERQEEQRRWVAEQIRIERERETADQRREAAARMARSRADQEEREAARHLLTRRAMEEQANRQLRVAKIDAFTIVDRDRNYVETRVDRDRLQRLEALRQDPTKELKSWVVAERNGQRVVAHRFVEARPIRQAPAELRMETFDVEAGVTAEQLAEKAKRSEHITDWLKDAPTEKIELFNESRAEFWKHYSEQRGEKLRLLNDDSQDYAIIDTPFGTEERQAYNSLDDYYEERGVNHYLRGNYEQRLAEYNLSLHEQRYVAHQHAVRDYQAAEAGKSPEQRILDWRERQAQKQERELQAGESLIGTFDRRGTEAAAAQAQQRSVSASAEAKAGKAPPAAESQETTAELDEYRRQRRQAEQEQTAKKDATRDRKSDLTM